MLKRNWRTYKLDLAREATKGPSPLSIKLEKVSVVPAEHIYHYFFVFLYYAVAIAREGRWVIFWISVFLYHFIILLFFAITWPGWGVGVFFALLYFCIILLYCCILQLLSQSGRWVIFCMSIFLYHFLYVYIFVSFLYFCILQLLSQGGAAGDFLYFYVFVSFFLFFVIALI